VTGRPVPLRGEKQFQHVFRHGRRARSQALRAIACANGLGRPRLGMIIARRRIGRAVDRNRLKRIIRESVARHENLLRGMDLVITPEPDAAKRDNAALRAELASLWPVLRRKLDTPRDNTA